MLPEGPETDEIQSGRPDQHRIDATRLVSALLSVALWIPAVLGYVTLATLILCSSDCRIYFHVVLVMCYPSTTVRCFLAELWVFFQSFGTFEIYL